MLRVFRFSGPVADEAFFAVQPGPGFHKNRVLSNGNWFPFRYAFFNGNGFYGRGFGGKQSDGHVDPGAVDFIGNSLRVQRAHAVVFASHDIEPLVPTEQDLVFANRFRAGGTTA